jgi:hypothetical protein
MKIICHPGSYGKIHFIVFAFARGYKESYDEPQEPVSRLSHGPAPRPATILILRF